MPTKRPLGARILRLGTFTLIALILVACGTGNDTRSSTEGLPDVLQQLTANPWLLNKSDSSLRYAGNTPITITFTSGYGVSGRTPCNTYRGTFTLDESNIKIDITSRTHRPTCGLEALAEYLSALRIIQHVEPSDEDRLVLTGVSNTRLSYNKVNLR